MRFLTYIDADTKLIYQVNIMKIKRDRRKSGHVLH